MSPSKSELKETILNSDPDDWEFIDMPQTWTLLSEGLAIETVGTGGSYSSTDIQQPEFASLPDSEHDERTQIRIMYNGTPFKQLPALRLDGGRIRMIKPNHDHDDGTRYLSEFEAQLSQIMSMDDFLSRQGATIDVEIRGRGI